MKKRRFFLFKPLYFIQMFLHEKSPILSKNRKILRLKSKQKMQDRFQIILFFSLRKTLFNVFSILILEIRENAYLFTIGTALLRQLFESRHSLEKPKIKNLYLVRVFVSQDEAKTGLQGYPLQNEKKTIFSLQTTIFYIDVFA